MAFIIRYLSCNNVFEVQHVFESKTTKLVCLLLNINTVFNHHWTTTEKKNECTYCHANGANCYF